ncbi:hypothetical protein BRADI_5g16757v3 [Brachypodium distachyon]|uniref:Uncharacterized protein n=1 Tax=Brachypodium distachyon TaxID=15368 RepID=A0A2K2CHR6_BRADI|nr:hypothetical protein BRADI_5g16757v3 [Brachypodium distachyon]
MATALAPAGEAATTIPNGRGGGGHPQRAVATSSPRRRRCDALPHGKRVGDVLPRRARRRRPSPASGAAAIPRKQTG